MSNRVRFLEVNRRGVDYVVGDLHGEWRLLERLLAHVRFDPARDRLLSVGDLLDRGPESARCAELLLESWFHAVLGNHEEMCRRACREFLDRGAGGSWWSNWRHNGGDWFAQHVLHKNGKLQLDDWARRLLARIQSLPLVIVVGRGAPTRFNIVHAELPPWAGDAEIDGGQLLQRPEERERLIWGRSLMLSDEPAPAQRAGLSPTYCGHTPDTGIRVRASHVCLDTGAVYPGLDMRYRELGFGLTLVRPGDRSAWMLHPEHGRLESCRY